MVESPNERWLQVGHSQLEASDAAGAEAAGEALGNKKDAKLLVVFCAETHDMPALLQGIESVAAGVPLIGCSTAGEIAISGPGDAGVVATALGGRGFAIKTACATGVSSRLREASGEVARSISGVEHKAHKVLMLLTDGLSGDQQEVVRGAYAAVGATVPLVGGCAGDGLKMKRTYQFFGRKVITDGIVGAALGSDAPIGIGVRHGWRTVGEPMLVTESSGNRVYKLDEQPALDVYLDRLQAPESARSDPELFTRFAITHPLGLTRRSGEVVRFVGEANFADRSLGCIAAVPQGGLTWFMEGDSDSVLAATDAACADALSALGGRPAKGLLAFDCIARRGVLGDRGIRREVNQITGHAGGAPVAGFYTYGEIARTHGMSGFHNQTLVVLAIS